MALSIDLGITAVLCTHEIVQDEVSDSRCERRLEAVECNGAVQGGCQGQLAKIKSLSRRYVSVSAELCRTSVAVFPLPDSWHPEAFPEFAR